jgi:hypothetical protein
LKLNDKAMIVQVSKGGARYGKLNEGIGNYKFIDLKEEAFSPSSSITIFHRKRR